MAEQPDQVPALHRRASEWYEHNGSAADAIRHALAAEDFARAADLVELAMPAMRRSSQDATLLGWLKALPDGLVHFRPVLSAGYAGALMASGAGGWGRRSTAVGIARPVAGGFSPDRAPICPVRRKRALIHGESVGTSYPEPKLKACRYLVDPG